MLERPSMHVASFGRLIAARGFVLASMLLAGALAGCGSTSPYSPISPLSNASLGRPPAGDAVVRAWGRSLMHVPLPGAGCFKASYPAGAWSRIACSKPLRLPVPRIGKVDPAIIGAGKDYALSVSPHLISTAIGSFPDVTGVTRVKTVGVPSLGGQCICGNDAYTLQLNTDFYDLAPCANNAKCLGWEQLVYSNPAPKGGAFGLLYIQDWRIKTTSKALKCPAKSTGWLPNGGDCYYSSDGVSIPAISITQLGDVNLWLSAARSGDGAFISVGKTVYGMKKEQGDFMELSRHWTGAELNVFGDCCDSRAVFNPGSTLTVRLEADDGSADAPICQGNNGTTGETNNLSFVAPPSNPTQEKYPSILFTESNAGGGPASCAAVAGL